MPAVVSVLSWIGRSIERALKTYTLWSEYIDFSALPFVQVNSRKDIVSSIQEGLHVERSCYRLVGLSGLGKTRTAHQLIGEDEYLKSLAIYVDANLSPSIDALVADWVSLNVKAIVVVDNCDHLLHSRLVDEVKRNTSSLSLLTLDYNFDTVNTSSFVHKLSRMEDDELLQLLNPTYKKQLPDLDRIVKFAQGFPQMAVLLANARLADDPRVGKLSEDQLANKLLWGNSGEENKEYLNILQVCSLFDSFGIEKEVESQLQYISDFLKIDIDKTFECIQHFTDKGLIDRRGRFAQVVPKPLAIRLASQWWSKVRKEKQLKLVNGILPEMTEGFCSQIEKLDFHPEVKELTESLCGSLGNFGQAEVILSSRGSRLFRSFVIVNPKATSDAFYQLFESMNEEAIFNIEGDIRRNIVWALERLCFHSSYFEKSAWCMFKLAVSENESWSNNASGIFTQLFRVHLSGTEADPKKRLSLLKNALSLNAEKSDLVIISALNQAISTYIGGRTVGAEYQGSKPPLEEWKPKVWQDIFDYLDESFELLMILYSRGNKQKNQVMSHVGHSIRGLVSLGRLDMLDKAIRFIVEDNGPYWPAALDSIINALEHDKKDMPKEAKDSLARWLDLLDPDNGNLEEKLKIIVIDGPWTVTKGDDEQYTDVFANKARDFAKSVSQSWEDLIPVLPLLLTGKQNQTSVFAFEIAISISVDSINQLIDLSVSQLLRAAKPNTLFLVGLYRGLHEIDEDHWKQQLNKLLENDEKIYLYPELLTTGVVQADHLNVLVDLVEKEKIAPNELTSLSYGGITNNLKPVEISSFCLALANVDMQCKWPAFNIIYMYCYGNENAYKSIKNDLEELLVSIPIYTDHDVLSRDLYKWKNMADKLLAHNNDLAVNLLSQIVEACANELEYNDIWNYIKPLLLEMMEKFGGLLWPQLSGVITSAKGSQLYWLQTILKSENNFGSNMPSVLSVLSTQAIIDWCKTSSDKGPLFTASCVNIFDEVAGGRKPSDIFLALLEHFGDDKKVQSSLRSNIVNRGWEGSLVPYLKEDKASLSSLIDHPSINVRNWINDYISYIERQIEHESIRDDEQGFGFY